MRSDCVELISFFPPIRSFFENNFHILQTDLSDD